MSTTATTSQTEQPTLKLGAAREALSGNEDDLVTNYQHIPTFTDKYEERRWAKEQMAAAFRLWDKLGYNDGAGGHISLRDPVNPQYFWISRSSILLLTRAVRMLTFHLSADPYALHFGLIKASDLVLIDEDARPVEPTKHKVNRAGFMIHSALHKARPDINVAAHTHSPNGVAWSAFGRPIEYLTQDSCRLYNELAVYEGFGGVVLAKEEGENIAKALGPTKKNIILQNHGILASGGTVGEAMGWFVALERACERQLLIEAAAANGIPKKYIGQEEVEYTKKGSGHPAAMYMQFVPEYEKLLKETNGDFLL